MTDCVDMELDDKVFLRELAEMNRRSQIRSLKTSGIQEPALANWTFASAEGSPSIQMARRYVDNWPQMKENNLGLLLWGDVGTGKSFAAACIANALLEVGVPVLMTNFSKILNKMGGMYSEQRYRYIASLAEYPECHHQRRHRCLPVGRDGLYRAAVLHAV